MPIIYRLYSTLFALHQPYCIKLFAVLSILEIYEVTRFEVFVVVKIQITEEFTASIFRIPEDGGSNIPPK
jgi:hypothetical protein